MKKKVSRQVHKKAGQDPRKRAKRRRESQRADSSAGGATLVKRVLFRPERYRYVRNQIKSDGCVFCRSARAEISVESLCIYQSNLSQIVLNKFPYNAGHLLILPKSHTGHLLKLSDAEYLDLHATLRKAVAALEEVYKPAALNIGLNHGRTAGAGLPDHLHYHVIPRWEGDLNFFPLIAETKAVIESLDQTYEKLFKYFQEQI